MKVFAAVVDAGSFTVAAERLDMSRAMTSKYIATLEEHLGTRLLNRTTRRLSVTESGGVYYQRCVQILFDIEEAEQLAGQLSATPRGTLKITMPLAFGLHRLGPIVAEYAARFPDVRLELALSDRVVDLIEDGFDLAIRISALPESGLIARKLGVVSAVLCASPGYLKRHGTPRTLADLAAHSCLGYTYTKSGDEWQLTLGEQDYAIPIAGAIKADNGDMLRLAALSDAGLIYQPQFIVAEDLAAGRLVRVLSDYASRELGVYAIYPSRKHLSAKVRTFVDFLVERCAPLLQAQD
jgi:DNA-binding transcriptional LysR family regulator